MSATVTATVKTTVIVERATDESAATPPTASPASRRDLGRRLKKVASAPQGSRLGGIRPMTTADSAAHRRSTSLGSR